MDNFVPSKMKWFRKHIARLVPHICLLLSIHFANISVNILQNETSQNVFYNDSIFRIENEIESFVELILHTVFEKEFAIPDNPETQNGDQIFKKPFSFKSLEQVFNYNLLFIILPIKVTHFGYQEVKYSPPIKEIIPPPPKNFLA
ncbi:hypothetical protein [Aureibacter tunicatorum]|uniref:Uncharacterized protein n=1 Tax=Aureibacter tunicatorum TaxID=866807 RepID=A0AAE3XSB6_9BACT|nr:hypothetical protein [Aureibacter tunicatorum]MDR6241080.1 hypothetical protein [Aureibacter tunicatorum]BDD03858.1 hypothetical protein AUTU_13410 [Aureibacter tunicatorum]